MSSPVRPELPTASVGSSQAPTAAVDNSAPFSNCPQSTYKSGKAVQTNGATSVRRPRHFLVYRFEPALLVVGRVLHDAMELARHFEPDTSWD
jgi:hypothetical protein